MNVLTVTEVVSRIVRDWRCPGTVWSGIGAGVALVGLVIPGCGTLPRLLKEMPHGLKYVVDNREGFELSDDPLGTTEPGTVIDPSEALDGCWGSVHEGVFDDTRVTVAGFWRFSSGATKAEAQVFLGVDGVPPPWYARPVILANVLSIQSAQGGRLVATPHSTRYAGVTDEGRLVFDADAFLVAAITQDWEMDGPYTLDGDFLFLRSREYNAPTQSPQDVTVYMRFDCALLAD